MESALRRSGRQRSEITVVAVTKKFSAEAIETAYTAGLRHVGENYVQEFAAKSAAVAHLPGLKVHLIGHLQSNKARQAAELFQTVETVDSAKLLRRLNDAAAERASSLECFIEVKLSDEDSKTGAAAEEVPELMKVAEQCPNLRLVGLMTVPPWSEDPETARPYFQRLAALAKEHQLAVLSMGMSGDFEVAIEEGATIVRLGTALFGARPKPGTVSAAHALQ